ncbi:aminotransferase class V-fold PLP-dependent enzyme [Fodinibius salsisoli]|uniref:Aminotransferase class V-fold PLP-dependent enzyme n=1 Tax=Fodinibius salsisoli TaxID=2820877 RepID=A0ABT3PNQ5_9BACT|nr:aminotransferase class V-fold PLP-dependent enzyme [Fodinibius salsisoli]MCW9707478.1 aminotransferase class V-fold PLP-dependent enzyme [Fodinibius salsisoli]
MDCQRHLFNLPANQHYLNCAYLSPQLKHVEEAGIQGIQRKNHPWEIKPDDFFEDSHRLRSLFADLISAESSQSVALMPAVSYGMATVAQNIDPQKGNEIILAGQQFPSNFYPWQRFCDQHDCTLRMIDPPNTFEERGKGWNERIHSAIGRNTLAVALGNVHWTDGTLFKLKEIAEQTRSSDAYLLVDGTQSVGALPLDVQAIQPDALICAGYKWLMGPYSMAFGYFSERMQQGTPLEEGWIVRQNSENFSQLVNYEEQYQPGALRFDVGERSNFILVPMMIEALRQIIDWEPANIQNYCERLTSDLVQSLSDKGYQIEDPEWRGHHLFGIRLPEHLTTEELQPQLEKRNIHLSLRGSALRIAPNVYNNKADITALQEVLSAV